MTKSSPFAAIATLTLIIGLSLTGCAPPSSEAQATSTATRWLETGDGTCPGLELGTLGQDLFAGAEVGEARPSAPDDAYRVEVAYEMATGQASRGFVEVRVAGDGAPCVVAWSNSAPW